jgi:hypothetical protein
MENTNHVCIMQHVNQKDTAKWLCHIGTIWECSQCIPNLDFQEQHSNEEPNLDFQEQHPNEELLRRETERAHQFGYESLNDCLNHMHYFPWSH